MFSWSVCDLLFNALKKKKKRGETGVTALHGPEADATTGGATSELLSPHLDQQGQMWVEHVAN